MKISLSRKSGDFHFEALNDSGNTLQIDGSVDIGGSNAGFRPMQLLLAAVGGCSAIDIVSILKKQRQQIEAFDIEVEGERQPIAQYSIWKNIHIVFKLKGKIDLEKAKKAAELSMEKYCSVSKTLEPTAHITHEVQVYE